MAEPNVKYSSVKLVTSDREEEELQAGGVPSSFCRFTSDQGMPAGNTPLQAVHLSHQDLMLLNTCLIARGGGEKHGLSGSACSRM